MTRSYIEEAVQQISVVKPRFIQKLVVVKQGQNSEDSTPKSGLKNALTVLTSRAGIATIGTTIVY